MNGRQAAREAAKRITDLEFVVAMQAQDIRDYNECILSLISGDSACLWCEERPECQLEAKGGKNGLLGCPEWWLRYRKEGDGESDGGEGEKKEDALQRLEEQGRPADDPGRDG